MVIYVLYISIHKMFKRQSADIHTHRHTQTSDWYFVIKKIKIQYWERTRHIIKRKCMDIFDTQQMDTIDDCLWYVHWHHRLCAIKHYVFYHFRGPQIIRAQNWFFFIFVQKKKNKTVAQMAAQPNNNNNNATSTAITMNSIRKCFRLYTHILIIINKYWNVDNV